MPIGSNLRRNNMSEQPLPISNLNDFIFCPVSIYFHSLDADTENLAYQDEVQLNGTAAHEKSDSGKYSTKKTVLQAVSVYSEKYNLSGKIDVFDAEKGLLTERKKKISVVYDGYVFQLYAQCFALREMGYAVKEMRLYSMDDNKVYPISLPENDAEMFLKFESLVESVNAFSFENFKQDNSAKCSRCIYEPLCSFSVEQGVM